MNAAPGCDNDAVMANGFLENLFSLSNQAAVVNYTKNGAREYAARRVRVNALCPGFFPAALRPAGVRPLLEAARWMREQVQAMPPQMSAV
jgi:NAD(P)-dependent dehydrogenase (short-subunit alcohol dehydrogenase family)